MRDGLHHKEGIQGRLWDGGEGLHHKEGIMHIFSSLQSLRGRVSDLEKIESQLIRSDHRIQAS